MNLLLYRGSSKLEEACDLYVRAANSYKMAKNWCGKRISPNYLKKHLKRNVVFQ